MLGQAILGAFIGVGAVVSYLQARAAKAKVQEIHVMVNSQKTDLENRILLLEAKLDLARGEAIPTQQIVTPLTEGAS